MKIRSLLLGAAAGLCITAFGFSTANAQIYTSYTSTIINENYTPLGAGRTILAPETFREGQAPGTLDRDDGYYFNGVTYGVNVANLPGGAGFRFDYNGTRDSVLQINVNGFAAAGSTAYFLNTDNPLNLFRKDPPNAVIAPYWGDHMYRSGDDIPNGFIPSEISVQIVQENDPVLGGPIRVLVVEWKDLNINYNFDPLNPNDILSPNKTPHASSVGTFQLRIYEAGPLNDPKRGSQGDIEFHYSTVGNPSVPGPVKTSGAAIGIESAASQTGNGPTTFMNGLYVEDPTSLNYRPGIDIPLNVRTQTTLSSTWAPSRANNNVILFRATPQPGIAGWGDGDANLSQLIQHRNLPQNLFVTTTDVITIMRSVAANRALDSLRLRGGYHGDVNHNGRYYYNGNTRVNIPTRSDNEFEDLPNAPIGDIYFEANEYDAGLIMAYMAGKIPTMPWLIDTVVEYGKVGVEVRASNINVPGAIAQGNGTYKLPLYLNGVFSGPMGVRFDVNGTVTAVELIEKEGNQLMAQFNGSRVVIAGRASFAANEPVGYVVVATGDNNIEMNDIRFNDQHKGSMKIQGGKDAGEGLVFTSSPNPVSSSAAINVVLPSEGRYTIAVYDMFGNKVKTIADANLPAGQNNFTWNGTDEAGSAVSSGMYIYRLEGNGVQMSRQITVVR